MSGMHHGVMFDPDSVKTYKLFHGDSRDVLRRFKPNSIHSIHSTLCVINSDESREENTVLHELYYKLLVDSGSLFTHGKIVGLEEMGWIKQYDILTTDHYTKSDDFYRKFNDTPINETESGSKARIITKTDLYSVDVFDDIMCNFYTPPGGIALDPTMGNGRYVIAALQRGRRGIGIEMVAEQYNMAARRLALYEDGISKVAGTDCQ